MGLLDEWIFFGFKFVLDEIEHILTKTKDISNLICVYFPCRPALHLLGFMDFDWSGKILIELKSPSASQFERGPGMCSLV